MSVAAARTEESIYVRMTCEDDTQNASTDDLTDFADVVREAAFFALDEDAPDSGPWVRTGESRWFSRVEPTTRPVAVGPFRRPCLEKQDALPVGLYRETIHPGVCADTGPERSAVVRHAASGSDPRRLFALFHNDPLIALVDHSITPGQSP